MRDIAATGLDPKLSHVSFVSGSTLRGIVVTGLSPRLSQKGGSQQASSGSGPPRL